MFGTYIDLVERYPNSHPPPAAQKFLPAGGEKVIVQLMDKFFFLLLSSTCAFGFMGIARNGINNLIEWRSLIIWRRN